MFGGKFFFAYTLLIALAIWTLLANLPWSPLTPILLFIFTTSLWDVFMRAFSGPIRVQIAFTAILTLLVRDEAEHQPAEAPEGALSYG